MNRWTGAAGHPAGRAPGLPDADAREVQGHAQPGGAAARRGAVIGAGLRQAGRPGPAGDPAQVEAALDACRKRTPRLPLASEDQAAGCCRPTGPARVRSPNWVRLLANFPKGGRAWVAQTYHSETKGRLSPKLKAEIAYVAARNDRAWYALGHAVRRLKDLGLDRRRDRGPRSSRRLSPPGRARGAGPGPEADRRPGPDHRRRHRRSAEVLSRSGGGRDRLPRHAGRVLRSADRGRRPPAGALKSRSHRQQSGCRGGVLRSRPARSWPASLPFSADEGGGPINCINLDAGGADGSLLRLHLLDVSGVDSTPVPSDSEVYRIPADGAGDRDRPAVDLRRPSLEADVTDRGSASYPGVQMSGHGLPDG